MNGLIDSVHFADAVAAGQRLPAVLGETAAGLGPVLLRVLSETADPDQTLIRLERYLDCTDDAAAERARMAADEKYTRLLATVLDQSHFLTDTLCRWPEHMRWLRDEAPLDRARSAEEMAAEIRQWLAGNPSLAPGVVLRRFRQREILRIAVRDIYVHTSLPSLTEDLSNLADAAVEVAIEQSMPTLERRYGVLQADDGAGGVRPVTFTVLGMGKLGGRELNFSSDIDLVFLYSDETESTGGTSGSITALDYYHKLGESIIRLVSELTAEGNVFRVDMRLRPYGRLSPLAISLDRALDYYSSFAQAWERQALIKVRGIAGDKALADEFIARTRPLVFPRYFDDETLDSIRQIKQQMESQIAERNETDIEVKLGRGGIRDIEFTVQILQMLNGGRMPDLRTRNTLEAIHVLGMRAHLPALDAAALARNYMFMRQVEHRLQIEGSLQCHVLPTNPVALEQIARRLGYQSARSFMSDYREHAGQTRDILDRFLSTEGAGTLWTYDLLSVHSEGNTAKARLAQYGFKDTEKARRGLIELGAGPDSQPHPFHVRRDFAAVVPTLLEVAATTHDPDETLVRLSRVLTNIGTPGAVYSMLKTNTEFCQYLVALVDNSEYLSELLVRNPALFDVVEAGTARRDPPTREELQAEMDTLCRAYESEAAPYRFRDAQILRIALRELFHDAPVTDVGRELTQVAELVLQHVFERARDDVAQRHGRNEGLAVLGLGKLGGREMGYGSDLDLVFVYDSQAPIESDLEHSEYFAAIASRMVQRIKDLTRYGNLYDLDARLRPDGRKGVLAVSSRRLREYYLHEAQPWERMALMKARAVAGDAEFGARMEEAAREVAFLLPLDATTIACIDDIRRRLVQGTSARELKKAEGGLVEIEFAVRLLQLRHVADVPDLRRPDVLGALDVLVYGQLVPTATYHALREGYLLLRKIENRIRMMHGRSNSALPEEPEACAALARRLGIERDLQELVRFHKTRVHRIYMTLMEQLAGE